MKKITMEEAEELIIDKLLHVQKEKTGYTGNKARSIHIDGGLGKAGEVNRSSGISKGGK